MEIGLKTSEQLPAFFKMLVTEPVFLLFIVILILLFGLPIVLLIIANRQREERRSRNLRQTAEQNGFIFCDEHCDDLFDEMYDFTSFRHGFGRTIRNVMTATHGNNTWKVFDFSYKTHSCYTSETWSQTVIFTRMADFTFPEFMLIRKKFFSTAADMPCKNNVEFKDFAQFTKKYCLEGKDESSVKSFFTPPAIRFFLLKNPQITIEAKGDQIIMYRFNKQIRPEDIIGFVAEASQIMQVLTGDLTANRSA